MNKISKNSPVFDNCGAGEAFSAKSLDLSAPTHMDNPNNITSTLNKYVDKIVDFKEVTRKGFTLSAKQIQVRRLGILTIGRPNGLQSSAIQASQNYAASRGVEFTLKSVTTDPLGDALRRGILANPKPRNTSTTDQRH